MSQQSNANKCQETRAKTARELDATAVAAMRALHRETGAVPIVVLVVTKEDGTHAVAARTGLDPEETVVVLETLADEYRKMIGVAS